MDDLKEERLLSSEGINGQEEERGKHDHDHDHDHEPVSVRLRLAVFAIVVGVILITMMSVLLLSKLRPVTTVDSTVVLVGAPDSPANRATLEFCAVALEKVMEHHHEAGVTFKFAVMEPEELYHQFTSDHQGAVDIVVGAQLPYAHAHWLNSTETLYKHLGTAYELSQVTVAVPLYTGLTDIEAFALALANNGSCELLGRVYSLDAHHCPLCDTIFREVRSNRSLFAGAGGEAAAACLQLTVLDTAELLRQLPLLLAAREPFALLWSLPSFLPRLLPAASVLPLARVEHFAPAARPDVGQTLIRRSAHEALQEQLPKALELFSACFLGNAGVADIDYRVSQPNHSVPLPRAVHEYVLEHHDYFKAMIRNVEDVPSRGGGGHH